MKSCQADLIRDNGHKYFLTVLSDLNLPPEHRTMAAFVMACIVKDNPAGQVKKDLTKLDFVLINFAGSIATREYSEW